MSWSEFSTLLAGVMPETPLGQVVSIRSENDKEVLKNLTKEQHEIRNKWRDRNKQYSNISEEEMKEKVKEFQILMKNAFS